MSRQRDESKIAELTVKVDRLISVVNISSAKKIVLAARIQSKRVELDIADSPQ